MVREVHRRSLTRLLLGPKILTKVSEQQHTACLIHSAVPMLKRRQEAVHSRTCFAGSGWCPGNTSFRLNEIPNALLAVVHIVLLWPGYGPEVWLLGSSNSFQFSVYAILDKRETDSLSKHRAQGRMRNTDHRNSLMGSAISPCHKEHSKIRRCTAGSQPRYFHTSEIVSCHCLWFAQTHSSGAFCTTCFLQHTWITVIIYFCTVNDSIVLEKSCQEQSTIGLIRAKQKQKQCPINLMQTQAGKLMRMTSPMEKFTWKKQKPKNGLRTSFDTAEDWVLSAFLVSLGALSPQHFGGLE